MEQPAFKSEADLPDLSPGQAEALSRIKNAGGIYHCFEGGWWPPRHRVTSARVTDRAIRSLISNQYLTATKTTDSGAPHRDRLTFP